MHHVVFADAEHALAVQPGGRHQARMYVLDALGIAGRAGGVEPERHFVGQRIGGEGLFARLRDQLLEQVHFAAGKHRSVVFDGADQDDSLQVRQLAEDRPDGLRQRRGDDQRRDTRVGEDVGVLRHGEERIERDGHVAGAQRAPERHWVVDRIVQQQRDAVLMAQAQRAQCIGKAVRPRLQVAIGERAVGIDEGDLFGAAARDMRIDEIAHGVVGPARGEIVQRHPAVHRLTPRTAGRAGGAPTRPPRAAGNGRA